MIPNHDAYLLPADPGAVMCSDCGCDIEDHNAPDLGGGCGNCGGCTGFEEYTEDDRFCDEIDRAWDEYREGAWS